MSNVQTPPFEDEYTTEQEVSYLLDKQDNLKKSMNRYNTNVAVFQEKRDTFLQKLLDRNQIDELRNVSQLFDKLHYVETDLPDFVIVDVPDRYTNAVDVYKEYCVIEDEKKKLIDSTIRRLVNNYLTTKGDILESVVASKKQHIAFAVKDNVLIVNGHQLKDVDNGKRTSTNEVVKEPIIDYADDIFNLVKEHTCKNSTIADIIMRPIVDNANKSVIYSWA